MHAPRRIDSALPLRTLCLLAVPLGLLILIIAILLPHGFAAATPSQPGTNQTIATATTDVSVITDVAGDLGHDWCERSCAPICAADDSCASVSFDAAAIGRQAPIELSDWLSSREIASTLPALARNTQPPSLVALSVFRI